jgi:hypothetical protein
MLFFGILDLVLFVYVAYFLGPPGFNRSSFPESVVAAIFGIITMIAGGDSGADIMDFVSLGAAIVVAACAFYVTLTIASWIRSRQPFVVDRRTLLSHLTPTKLMGFSPGWRVAYLSQIALIASILVGVFVRSPGLCYIAMIVFIALSVLGLAYDY